MSIIKKNCHYGHWHMKLVGIKQKTRNKLIAQPEKPRAELKTIQLR